MVLPGPARLSVRALTWLLDTEQVGEPHVVLAPTAVWHPPTERDEVHAQARAEIAALGWYDDRKRLEVEVAVALTMLCRAELEFFGWMTSNQATVGVLAAGSGRHGLLAVRDGNSVWLRHTGCAVLAETLAGQTADVPAGRGKPVTVSRAEVMGSARSQRITEAAVRVGPASTAVRRVQQLVTLATVGNGELYAAARDGVGRYQVSEPVCYADTHHGRYLTLATGQDQVLVAPASRADLVARLKDRRRSVSS
jgi:hypothetical protein